MTQHREKPLFRVSFAVSLSALVLACAGSAQPEATSPAAMPSPASAPPPPQAAPTNVGPPATVAPVAASDPPPAAPALSPPISDKAVAEATGVEKAETSP